MSKPDQRPGFSYLLQRLTKMKDVTEEAHEMEDRRDEVTCGQDRVMETYLSITEYAFLAHSHNYYEEAEAGLDDLRSECRLLSRSARVRRADKERMETAHTIPSLTCSEEEVDEDTCCQC